jgi:hypothetical protein
MTRRWPHEVGSHSSGDFIPPHMKCRTSNAQWVGKSIGTRCEDTVMREDTLPLYRTGGITGTRPPKRTARRECIIARREEPGPITLDGATIGPRIISFPIIRHG